MIKIKQLSPLTKEIEDYVSKWNKVLKRVFQEERKRDILYFSIINPEDNFVSLEAARCSFIPELVESHDYSNVPIEYLAKRATFISIKRKDIWPI